MGHVRLGSESGLSHKACTKQKDLLAAGFSKTRLECDLGKAKCDLGKE